MLSSTAEYLDALRNGNYLLFLEWPSFIFKHYSAEMETPGTDFLMDCLVFEWLREGLGENDAQYLALLYAVYETEPCPLVGQLEFNLMSIYSALFVCLSLQKNNLYGYVLPQTEVTGGEITHFMNQMTTGEKFNVADDFREALIKRSQEIDSLMVKAAYKKINDIRKIILTMERYIELLGWDQRNQRTNASYDLRFSVAFSLLSFLREQDSLSEIVRLEIANSVEIIRQQHPMGWEHEFLDMLSPPTLKMKAVLWASTLRSRFFNMVSSNGQARTEEEPATENSLG